MTTNDTNAAGNGATLAQADQFAASALSASLTVKDLQRSRAWYRDVLGFAIDREMEHEGTLRAVAVRAGAVRLMLNQDNGAKGWERTKGEGFSLHLTTSQNVDEIAARDQGGRRHTRDGTGRHALGRARVPARRSGRL